MPKNKIVLADRQKRRIAVTDDYGQASRLMSIYGTIPGYTPILFGCTSTRVEPSQATGPVKMAQSSGPLIWND